MPLASALAALLLALAFVLAPLRPATAQASDEQLDAILKDIDKKTDQYSKFRSLLSDPDQAKRMAAFHAMTNSGIATLQEMALDHAFNSGDPAMQSVALQSVLTKTKALTFRLELADQLSEETMETIAKFGGGGFRSSLRAGTLEQPPFPERLITYTGNSSGQGQVTGLSLNYVPRIVEPPLCWTILPETCLENCHVTRFEEPVQVSLSIR